MPKYTCERCLKEFSHKLHYYNHLKRKLLFFFSDNSFSSSLTPCQNNKGKKKEIVQKMVNEKIDDSSNKKLIGEIENKNILTNNNMETSNIEIKNTDGMTYLKTIENNTIDLILTDPPYLISRNSGMNTHYNNVKLNEKKNIEYMKTITQWEEYKLSNKDIQFSDKQKNNFLKYGTIYGKKYCVKTDYGNWDKEFTVEMLDGFIKEYYKKLKKGGTLIMFFDIWKITILKELFEKHKFKQIRFIEWIKTNPQPLNSSVNYLTNCREIALLGVKGGKPTFNSKYDNGIYMFPLQGGKKRIHPTQKSLSLFEELIIKHSNVNDTVMDTFLGGGTTAIACKNTKRNFKGCEISKEYYDKIVL